MSAELKRYTLFADLTADEVELLEDLLEEQEIRQGKHLFREGQESEGLILLVSGAVALESKRAGDLGELRAPAPIGAVGLVAVGPRELSAKASEPCRLLVLSRIAFHRLSEDAPRAACRILEAVLSELAGRTRATLDRLT